MIAGLVPAVGFATVRGDGVLVVVLPPQTIVATVDRYLGLVILPDARAVGDDDVVVDVDGDVEDAGGPHAAEFAGEVGPTGISASAVLADARFSTTSPLRGQSERSPSRVGV